MLPHAQCAPVEGRLPIISFSLLVHPFNLVARFESQESFKGHGKARERSQEMVVSFKGDANEIRVFHLQLAPEKTEVLASVVLSLLLGLEQMNKLLQCTLCHRLKSNRVTNCKLMSHNCNSKETSLHRISQAMVATTENGLCVCFICNIHMYACIICI